jgi:broad specificity phosphatase PhoE
MRHGESEGNLVRTLYEQGAPHKHEARLMKTHTSERRLTQKGVEQAKTAGEWLRANWFQSTTDEGFLPEFYVSPYIRAVETAGNLGFGDHWHTDNRIVERNWGQLDMLTYDERLQKFGEVMDYDDSEAFFWRPSDGETLQDMMNRLRDFIRTLHKKCKHKNVLVVCHGETMWAFRTILEHWSPQMLASTMRERNSQMKHLNCRIIHYERDMNSGSRIFSRVRFIDPTHPHDRSRNLDWQRIRKSTHSHQELREYANSFPRLLED